MYTATKPFCAGHETLAGSIFSQTERPTITKVQRDLFLNPFNDKEKTDTLKVEWKEALRPILINFNLLVIGYGGNDGSLMDYLQEINSDERKPIHWCKRNKDISNDKIEKLLTQDDYIVTINDFDELMYALHDALGYNIFEQLNKPEEHQFVKDSKKRIEKLNDKLKEILERLKQKELAKDYSSNVESLFTGAFDYLFRAFGEKDINKKDRIYLEGIEKYPENTDLLYEYALFLKNSRKDYDRAEEFYKKAIDIDPNSASKLGNYAHHLIISKNDFISAKKCIDKAFALQPGDLRLLLELWFYRYAHYQKYYKQGERELEKLIKHGAKSTGWNLQAHIEIATKNKHPDIEKLKYFADKITNFTNTSLLTGLIWTIWHLPVIIFTGYGENIGVLGIITTTIGAIAACFIINWIRLKSGMDICHFTCKSQ